MSDKFYTVEEIAELIKIHPKTIQRYIREGKLKANKVGKAWRISGHDLSTFTEAGGITTVSGGSFSEGAATGESAAGNAAFSEASIRKGIQVSAVIDIPVSNTQESIRISNTLTAALNSKPSDYGASSLRTQYLMPENIIRVMIWGSLDFTKVMMDYISSLTE